MEDTAKICFGKIAAQVLAIAGVTFVSMILLHPG
jgi:hypothetical protein